MSTVGVLEQQLSHTHTHTPTHTAAWWQFYISTCCAHAQLHTLAEETSAAQPWRLRQPRGVRAAPRLRNSLPENSRWNTKSAGAPTVCGPSSVNAAAVRQAAGPRKAVACARRRTVATGQPRAISASALGPATAVAAIAATGGSRLTYVRTYIRRRLSIFELYEQFV